MSSDAIDLTEALKQVGDQLSVLLEPMKCGSSALTALPTFFFLAGTIMLLHQVVTASGRTLFWRRTNRDLILQEILLVWLIGQSLKLWWATVKLISLFAAWLWAQMLLLYPKTSYYSLLSGYKSAPNLPAAVLFLLEPSTMKHILLILISILPLILIQNIHSRNNFSQFMFWIGTHRSIRSEIGTAGYYLERPVPSFMPDQEPETPFRNSDPSFKSMTFTGVNKIKQQQRSKSV